MRLLFTGLLIVGISGCAFAGEFFIQDGQVKYYKYDINGVKAIDEADRDIKEQELVAFDTITLNTSDIAPKQGELDLLSVFSDPQKFIEFHDPNTENQIKEKMILKEIKKLDDLKALNTAGIDKTAEIASQNTIISTMVQYYKDNK